MRRAVLATVAVLAACAQTQTQPPAPVQSRREPPPVAAPPVAAPAVAAPAVDEETRQVSELLGYYHKVAQLGPEDQKRELAGATQTFSRERSNASRVRLALLYAMPGTSFQDESRAAQLLEPLTTPAGGGTMRQFAGLLQVQIAERQKAQKRADQLKEQVDALRAIEKQLIDRGQQPPPRK
jgi:hypothetical protein